MNSEHILRAMLPLGAAGLFSVSTAQASIVATGNVDTTSYTYIGGSAAGTLAINGGSAISSAASSIGQSAGVTGSVSVDGTNSKWTASNTINVGYSGTGVLSITNGATLNGKSVFVASNAGSTGTLTIDGAGSSINNTGGGFKVGVFGNGSMSITNGAAATLKSLAIGNSNGSAGAVTVDGANSMMTISNGFDGALNLGYSGTGTSTATGKLYITNGGSVVNTNSSYANASIAYDTGSSASAIVNGTGSTWTNNGTLYVGRSGTGTLSIGSGGDVTAAAVSINSKSILTTDVGSMLTVGGNAANVSGSGTITNAGTIRLVAGASAANGTYTPITASTWANTGTIQALGGVWNSTNHTVTVNSAITTTAGTAASMDLYTNQRGLVTDPSTGNSVGLGFQATATSNPITFSATTIGGSELSSLQSLLGTGKSVLSDWSFTTTGTTVSSSNPVYLSLSAGAGQSLAGLAIWDFNGSAWSQLSPTDLAYNGNYASFTALNLKDIAVSGTETASPTPIPAALWLLGSGLMGLLGIRRKNSPADC
jgi:T5SS/PEP-CTERM-associated repeat protein